MPSFGNGVGGGAPSIRGRLVSFSQNSSRGHRAVRARTDLERVIAELVMDGPDARPVGRGDDGWLATLRVPRPFVAEPERRQDVQRCRLRALVPNDDPHQDVGRRRLRVVDLDDPVAVVIEDAGIEQLVLGLELGSCARCPDQVVVRERGLRVVVAPAQPGAARDGIEVPPVLLDVLAVVALPVRQPEHPLLEDGVDPVPQRERERQPIEDVGHARHAVFVPAVGARPGVVVREPFQASPLAE